MWNHVTNCSFSPGLTFILIDTLIIEIIHVSTNIILCSDDAMLITEINWRRNMHFLQNLIFYSNETTQYGTRFYMLTGPCVSLKTNYAFIWIEHISPALLTSDVRCFYRCLPHSSPSATPAVSTQFRDPGGYVSLFDFQPLSIATKYTLLVWLTLKTYLHCRFMTAREKERDSNEITVQKLE